MRISKPGTAIRSLGMTIAAIQSGEQVTFDNAKQQVMAGAGPWPRLYGKAAVQRQKSLPNQCLYLSISRCNLAKFCQQGQSKSTTSG
jgi:hypothetical protein